MKQIQKQHNERKTLTDEGEDDLLVAVRCKKGRHLILKQTTEGKKNRQICPDDKQRLKTGLSLSDVWYKNMQHNVFARFTKSHKSL